MVIKTQGIVHFRYEPDSSDDEEERDRRRKMDVIRNARIDEHEARKDAGRLDGAPLVGVFRCSVAISIY